MSRLKVVHFIDSLGFGGTEMMLLKLLSRMNRERFDNTVLSMMPWGPIGDRIAALGLPVHTLGMRQGRLSVTAFLRLVQFLRALKPAVLQTWLANADLTGLVAARLAGVSCVVWNIRDSIVNTTDCSRVTCLAKRACALLSGWPAAVVTNSVAGRLAHEKLGYRPREWNLIPNGFDLDSFRPDSRAYRSVRLELGVPLKDWVIGIAGREHRVKDHATFLRAAALLRSRKTNVHFIMVGAGLSRENTESTALVPELLEQGVLHMLGGRRDVARIIAAMDVFSLTSLCEGFPNVVGEAMACGVPCVVTETAGDAPLIIGDTGVVIPAHDVKALAHAWQRMIDAGHENCAAVGMRARTRIAERYSLDSVTESYQTLYARLLATTHASDSAVQRCANPV